MGRLASSLSTVEGCHLLTSLYSVLLSGISRSTLGAFYTPPALTNRLLDMAEEAGTDWTTARVLDPASGGGAFLLETAMRMRKNMEGSAPEKILTEITTRLAGFEIDPHAASLSQAALEIVLADLAVASGCTIPAVIQVGDTLEIEAVPTYDLVVGNPPYGRVTLSESQRQRYSRSLYGHANLYGVFSDVAVRWTRAGGAIAFLTPTSVLGGQYYASLRRLLAEEAPPVAIDFVHARKGVFEDVLQETLLALYKRGGPRGRFQVHYLNIETEGEARLTKNGKVGLPDDTMAPWLAPRQPSHAKLIAAAEKLDSRLRDWGYEVSTGPLVWNRFKSQLRQEAGRSLHPLIWAEAVTSDGRFIFRADKKNHAPFFEIKDGDEWLVVRKECVLVQRTTAKEQPRRLIAAQLPKALIKEHGGVVVENHLNMVRAIAEPKVSAAAVAAMLNSEVVDQLFRCISGSVAVSAFELEALPLPEAAQMAKIESLIVQKASRDAINSTVRELYGLPKK
jgi:adenine-specific DNA-methyltransferase